MKEKNAPSLMIEIFGKDRNINIPKKSPVIRTLNFKVIPVYPVDVNFQHFLKIESSYLRTRFDENES